VEDVTTGVIAPEVLHHTGGHTSPAMDTRQHSTDSGNLGIFGITDATKAATR